jgi:MFS family permease
VPAVAEPYWLLTPPGAGPDARRLILMRALRGFGDGCVSLLLPVYLLALGHSPFEVGLIATATLLGSGALVLALGLVAHRCRRRPLALAASVLMLASGVAFAAFTGFWPLLVIAFVGTLSPSGGDNTVFLPLEHAMLSQVVAARHRTAVFARYSLMAGLAGSAGALAAALPEWWSARSGVPLVSALQAMFAGYGLLGVLSWCVYRRLTPAVEAPATAPAAPLAESRGTVLRLAALFSLDSFAGGFAVQSLLAMWLYLRFDLSLAAASQVFFCAGLLAALSYLASAWIARRIGLVNTMVYTHLPANLFLVLVPLMPTLEWALAFLLLRFALSSMDVPARTSYVMAVVPPHERAAAASFTAVPRSLAGALSPALSGAMLGASAFGWPLIVCGGLKIVYDLALLAMFSALKPPEERES